MYPKHFIVMLALVAGAVACSKRLADNIFEGFMQPAHFPAPVYRFQNNPITPAGFRLGRKLFYDPVLSADSSISCGSCHIQTSAFTHHGHTVSHGIFDSLGTRNAPPVMNLAWSTSFMWDGGITDLDLLSIAPITNHVEMGETMAGVLQKLQRNATYRTMFAAAYTDRAINTANFLKALSQFMLLCTSSNSKYDSVMSKTGAAFTALESAGYRLVQQRCSPCHSEPLFTDHSFRSNGLAPSTVNDVGRYQITQQPGDRYRFKVPTLRNLAFTAPYMHDGRLLTLEAVLDHYAQGVAANAYADRMLSKGIALSATERQQVLAFLATLNDRTFLLNSQLSPP